MSATYEVHEGCTTCISDKGRAKLASEQRLARVDRLYVEIRLGALGGAVLTLAALVIKQLWSLT